MKRRCCRLVMPSMISNTLETVKRLAIWFAGNRKNCWYLFHRQRRKWQLPIAQRLDWNRPRVYVRLRYLPEKLRILRFFILRRILWAIWLWCTLKPDYLMINDDNYTFFLFYIKTIFIFCFHEIGFVLYFIQTRFSETNQCTLFNTNCYVRAKRRCSMISCVLKFYKCFVIFIFLYAK